MGLFDIISGKYYAKNSILEFASIFTDYASKFDDGSTENGFLLAVFYAIHQYIDTCYQHKVQPNIFNKRIKYIGDKGSAILVELLAINYFLTLAYSETDEDLKSIYGMDSSELQDLLFNVLNLSSKNCVLFLELLLDYEPFTDKYLTLFSLYVKDQVLHLGSSVDENFLAISGDGLTLSTELFLLCVKQWCGANI